jgi:hypothetical protein
MNKQRRIRRFTVEREQTFIFRSHEIVLVGWCDQCELEVELVTVANAAREAGLSELVLYRLIEGGEVHFIQEDEVNIFACLNSVRCIQQKLEMEAKREGERS